MPKVDTVKQDIEINEKWKIIKKFPDYKISNTGKVFSLIKNKEMKLIDNEDGYNIVNLHNNDGQTNFQIHRLVAEYFLKKFDKDLIVKHKDNDKKNNYYKNLELFTKEEHAENVIRINDRTFIKCDLDGNELETYTYDKMKELYDINQIKGINKCVNGTIKTSQGFIWKLKSLGKANDKFEGDRKKYTKIGEIQDLDFSEYGINKDGEIINFRTGNILKLKQDKRGNGRYGLTIDKKQHYFTKQFLLNHVFVEENNDENKESIVSSDPYIIDEEIYNDKYGKWRYIDNFNNKYKIYDNGEIFSLKSNKFMLKQMNLSGYYHVTLSDDNVSKNYLIHRLVVEAFIGKIPDNKVVDHIDRNKTNNNINNLRIVTQSVNGKNRDFNNSTIIQKFDKNNNLIKEYIRDDSFYDEHDIKDRNFLIPAIHGETIEAYGFIWRCKNPLPAQKVKNIKKFKSIGEQQEQDFSKYGINKKGRICNLETEKYIVTKKISGYETAIIQINRKSYHMRIHHLIMDIFGSNKPREDGQDKIRFIDGDRTNFDLDNLEWF